MLLSSRLCKWVYAVMRCPNVMWRKNGQYQADSSSQDRVRGESEAREGWGLVVKQEDISCGPGLMVADDDGIVFPVVGAGGNHVKGHEYSSQRREEFFSRKLEVSIIEVPFETWAVMSALMVMNKVRDGVVSGGLETDGVPVVFVGEAKGFWVCVHQPFSTAGTCWGRCLAGSWSAQRYWGCWFGSQHPGSQQVRPCRRLWRCCSGRPAGVGGFGCVHCSLLGGLGFGLGSVLAEVWLSSVDPPSHRS